MNLDLDEYVVEEEPEVLMTPRPGGGALLGLALPLPIKVQPSPSTLFRPTAAVEVSEESVPEAKAKNSGNQGDADQDTSDEEDGTTEGDRVAQMFGYNGRDPTVPKPAFDAMVLRVDELERGLGESNRQNRTLMTRIAELEGKLEQSEIQISKREATIRRMEEREWHLSLKEKEIAAREQAVESLIRQYQQPQSSLPQKKANKLSVNANQGGGGGSGSGSSGGGVLVGHQRRGSSNSLSPAVEELAIPTASRPAEVASSVPKLPRIGVDRRSHSSLA
jgi:hypothetical protein